MLKIFSKPWLATLIVLFAIGSLLGCRAPDSPQAQRIVIINLVSHPILNASIKGIREELETEGFTASKLEIKEINANGEMDKIPGIVNEVLATHPALIIPVSTPVAQTVTTAAAPTQNVVFSTVTNPSDVGMDKRPRNVTGVSDAINYEASLKLIREFLPRARKIGIVYNAGERNSQFGIEQVKAIAPKLGFEIRLTTVSNSQDVLEAAQAMVDSIDAFYVGSDNTVAAAISSLVAVGRERKIPVFASDSGSVEQGAIAAVSVDYEALGHKAGAIVATILKTHEPAGDIPVVTYKGDVVVVNPKAARAFNTSIPASVSSRARLIEGPKAK